MRALYAFFFAFCAVIGLAGTAAAQSFKPCDDTVVDGANLFGSNVAQVQHYADQLVELGAVVRVRTLTSLGGFANLDQLNSGIEAQCPSWRDGSGQRRSNMLTFLVVYSATPGKSKVGLYYGGTWESALKITWPRILTQQFVPSFKAGDYVTATTNALGGVYSALGGGATPLPAPTPRVEPPPQSQRVQQTNSLPTPVVMPPQPAGPTDYTFLYVLLAVAVVVALIVLLVRRSRLADSRALSQQQAKDARDAVAGKITGATVSPFVLLGAELNSVSQGLPDEATAGIRTRIAELSTGYDAVSSRFASMQDGITTNPDSNGLSAESYDDAKRSYQALQQQITTIESSCAAVTNDIGALKKKKDGLAKEIAGLDAKCEEARAAIVATKTVYDTIAAKYPTSCWESVREKGAQALGQLQIAVDALAQAKAAMAASPPLVGAAFTAVETVSQALAEVASRLRSVTELDRNLQEAEASVADAVTQATKDLEVLERYEVEFDADIDDGIKPKIRGLREQIAAIVALLEAERPDVLDALTRARQTTKKADELMTQAVGEHEGADRLRKRAASSLRDARAAYSEAKEYIEDHERTAGAKAKKALEEADGFIAEAAVATALSTGITLAENAQRRAKDALKAATRAVKDDYDRRHPAPVSHSSPVSSGGNGDFFGGLVVGSLLNSGGGGHHSSPSIDLGFGGGSPGGGSIDIGSSTSGTPGGGSIDI